PTVLIHRDSVQVLGACLTVEENAETELTHAISKVKILIVEWEPVHVETVDGREKCPLHGGVGGDEPTPASFDSADPAVIEVHPAINPPHEAGDAHLACPLHGADDRDLVGGVIDMPVNVRSYEPRLRKYVAVKKQDKR